jgi:diguanylate cyclase (GGDEF)-like protein/PAS domain S-box-containing protein
VAKKGIAENPMLGVDDILRSLEPTLQLMEDAVIVMTADLDHPGPHVVFVNSAFHRRTGYQPDEIIGKSLHILDGLRTDRSLFARIRHELVARRRFTGEAIVYGKGGSELQVNWQIAPLFGDSGWVCYWLSTLRDTRKWRDAERGQKAAEGLYRQLVENQPDLICRFLPDTTLTFANAAYARFFQRRPEDLVGKRFIEFLSEKNAARVMANLSSVTPDDPARHYEHEIVRADGSVRWYLWNDLARFDENGDILSFQSVGTDITDRKRAEEALHRSHLLLDSISLAQSRFIAEGSEGEVFDQLLKDLLSVTESEFGFIGEVVHTDEGQAVFETRAITDISRNSEIRNFLEKYAADGFQFRNPRSLCGETLATGQPVIANSPGSDPRKGGVPKGHPPLEAFLGVPFRSGMETVGMAGIANRPGGYDAGLVQFLSPFLGTCANLIVALRNDRKRRQAEEALKRSDRQQGAILSNIPDIAWLKDDECRFIAVNEPFAKACGVTPEDLVGKTDFDIWPEHLARSYRADDREVMRSGESKRVEERLVDSDGNDSLVESIRTPIVNDGGKVIGTTGIARDVTDRKQAEEALFEEKERALVTLHSIGDAVITTDAKGTVTYLNRVAEALTGWLSADAQGLSLDTVFRIVDEETRKPVVDPVSRCIGEGRIVGLGNHTVLISREGEEHAIEDTVAPIRGRGARLLGTVLVFHDVTEARRVARQMAHDATHDALTDLVNRREFERRLEHAFVGAKEHDSRHALCYLDLDQFKLVNDTAGHAAGDELLKQVRGLLRGKFRGRDTLARLGGDEFGLLLDNCTVKRAVKIAEMVVATLRDFRFSWKGRTFHIGVSVGVAPVTADAESSAQILAQADVACYAAKERGRNRVRVYQKDGAEPPRQHREILRAATLRDALEEERFRLFCQPIVPLSKDGETPIRYELLLRLVDMGGEIVLPEAFIPAAERFGLMAAIDRWVIREGFSQYAAIFGRLPKAQIAINLSGNSLDDDTLLDYVRAQFDAFSLAPNRVCFEITETIAVRHLSRAAEFVSEITRMGGCVALDDFGSGLSSFSYLKSLPATCLKIDGSFVRDMMENPIDQAVVSAINEVGHVMGMTTIAEYAHSEAIVERLREMGVNYAQGDALGMPKPLEEVS